jgi:Family of unknown function (DUF6069)
VLVTASLVGMAAWMVQRLLARRGAAGWWPFVGSTALAISIIGPTWLAGGMASVVLIGMHLAVGLVLIAGFNQYVKTLSRGDDDAASLHDRRTGAPAASCPDAEAHNQRVVRQLHLRTPTDPERGRFAAAARTLARQVRAMVARTT